MTQSLKQRLSEGDVVIGTILFEFATPGTPHIMNGAGADFFVIDTEHSPWGHERVASLIAAGRSAGIPALVRPATSHRPLITRPLDAGADGLMIPMVDNGDHARQVVDWIRYPPLGHRGAAFGIAHDDYALGDVGEKITRHNEETVTIALIETVEGLESVTDIAAVDGVDVLWVGHFDLTLSLGIPGQFEHPRYLDALTRVSDAAADAGKAAGFMVQNADEAEEKLRLGFRCLAYWGDLWIYGSALRAGLDQVRKQLGPDARR